VREMDCTNKHCLWNAFDQCCHESEEGYEIATPNELDCPSSLRKDFEEQLDNIFKECASLLRYRNMKELIQIKKFIESQRN
jgi:hypothetical protein